jgi:hypothetical protein
MARPPQKILAFRRLTRAGSTRDLALLGRVRKRASLIDKKIHDPKTPSFVRPYLYVALATCLEADIKYKFRVIMEVSGNDILAFRQLFGESIIDLDMLHHVINESITFSDLVADSVSVSEAPTLIAKHETALSLLLGQPNKLRWYFQKCVEREKELDEYYHRYDAIIRDIDRIFQIRHAVVHDIFPGDGPIKWALRPQKIQEAAGSCLAFMLFADRSFEHALLHGVMSPDASNAKSGERHSATIDDVRKVFQGLQRRFPTSKKNFDHLEKTLHDLLKVISGILVNFDKEGNDGLSPHTVETYIAIWARIARALQLESSLYK